MQVSGYVDDWIAIGACPRSLNRSRRIADRHHRRDGAGGHHRSSARITKTPGRRRSGSHPPDRKAIPKSAARILVSSSTEQARRTDAHRRSGARAPIVALSCNAACLSAVGSAAQWALPLLDMGEPHGRRLQQPGRARVGLLASTAVHNPALSAKAFSARGMRLQPQRRWWLVQGVETWRHRRSSTSGAQPMH